MVKEVDLEFVQAIDTGEWDILAMRNNFDDVGDAINEHATELRALAYKQTQTITYGIEEAGQTTILRTNKHLRSKIVNAFVQVGDNVSLENIVSIIGVTNSIKLSDSEKAGKIRIFNILKSNMMFNDDLVVQTSSNRRVVINVTYESSEVGN